MRASVTQILEWKIPCMHSSGSWILRGSWTSKWVRPGFQRLTLTPQVVRVKVPRPAHAFQIFFELPTHSFSSFKVDQVRLSGENYKLYKGLRTQSCGSIEWRW